MRRKIELFFRGEFWLHLTTMFIILSLIVGGASKLFEIQVPIWISVAITIFLAVGKELFDKYNDNKNITISDICGTLLGGLLAIILHY